MNEIKVSLDGQRYTSKPNGGEIGKINNRISNNSLYLDRKSIKSFAENVGNHGQTFTPATFNGSRKDDNFEQMQMMVLDFDGSISINDINKRTEQYDLPYLFSYETFSSSNHDRFRVVFLNDVSVTDKRAAKIIKNELLAIFPEADRHDKDVSKMYFGGKKLLSFNESIPTINIESLSRNMTRYLKDKHGVTNYKKRIIDFAKSNGMALNKNNLLDISVEERSTEHAGEFDISDDNRDYKKSPSPFINIKGFGENLYYRINLQNNSNTSSCSVTKRDSKNHSIYRSSDLKNLSSKCRILQDFYQGKELHHDELFGIAANLIQIESGSNKFRTVLSQYMNIYKDKYDKWDYDLNYMKQSGYKPKSCNGFCPYKDMCSHGTNILSHIPRRGYMEKLANYNEELYSIEEVQDDLKEKFLKAVNANDKNWHIIKAQTAIGKTETYLNLMKQGYKFLIAVPTNKLKHDVSERAKNAGLDVIVTPSLDEIKDEIPKYIWDDISGFYKSGEYSQVYPYINKILEKEKIKCLTKHLDELKKCEEFSGSVITTHRRFLNMKEKTLRKYDAVIIDEDIVFCSILPNQGEIPISELKRVRQRIKIDYIKHESINVDRSLLAKKIKKLLEAIQLEETLITLPGFEWSDKDDGEDSKNERKGIDGISADTDIPSFCLAEYVIYRKSSEEKNLTEDSITFLKPFKFNKIKCIMISATADKDICEYVFGKQNVKFYECKQAGYTGTLNQYYGKSMSRACIDENKDVLKDIQKWSGFPYMITFKKYEMDDMYFGNAIGCDHLKGENINVVGTPYQTEFLYKLLPFTLGLSFDEDAKMKSCSVTHNGYKFQFTTFDDEVLRKFQFWMLESDLEQAVGRARLLRCDCTVNLFSSFPLRQASMKKFDYENIQNN